MRHAATLLIVVLASCLPSTNPLPAPPPPMLGHAAPELAVTNTLTGGAPYVVQAKVRLYLFGATWCGACGEILSRLDELRDKYAARGLTLVAIEEPADSADVQLECQRVEATTPIAFDARMAIAGEWRVSTLPTLFVVDRAGTIRFVHTGFRDGDDIQVEREIERLLPD